MLRRPGNGHGKRVRIAATCQIGQIATEFMLYTAVFMFIAIVALVVLGQTQTTDIQLQQNTVAKETGQGFANVFTLAVNGGQGFSYKYSFPKGVFGKPYKIDLRKINSQNPMIILDWEGNYGNFSYAYTVPAYRYKVEGSCITDEILESDTCPNIMSVHNDGAEITIVEAEITGSKGA